METTVYNQYPQYVGNTQYQYPVNNTQQNQYAQYQYPVNNTQQNQYAQYQYPVNNTQQNQYAQYQYPQPVISKPVEPQYILNQQEQSSNDNMKLTLSMIISISPLTYERCFNTAFIQTDFIYIFAAGFIVDNFNRIFIVKNMFIRTILNTIMLHIIFNYTKVQNLIQNFTKNDKDTFSIITGHFTDTYPNITKKLQ